MIIGRVVAVSIPDWQNNTGIVMQLYPSLSGKRKRRILRKGRVKTYGLTESGHLKRGLHTLDELANPSVKLTQHIMSMRAGSTIQVAYTSGLLTSTHKPPRLCSVLRDRRPISLLRSK